MWLQGPRGLPGAQYPLRVKKHKMHQASSSVGGTLRVLLEGAGLDASTSAEQVSRQLEADC